MFKDKSGWLVLLLGITLVRGLIYAAVTPPWQAPDEWGHFESSHLVAQWGRIELTAEDQTPGFEREIIGSAYEFRFWRFSRLSPEVMPARLDDTPTLGWHRTVTRPSLAYVLYAAFDKLVFHQDVVVQLYVLRTSSVFINVALVWICWTIAQEIFPLLSPPMLGVMLLMVFHPQHTFMRAVTNDGGLAELATSIIYLVLVRCWRRGWNWQSVLGIGVLLVVALWTKKTTCFLLIYLFLVAVVYAWWSRRLMEVRRVMILGIIVLGVVVVLIGVFLLPQRVNVVTLFQKGMSLWSDSAYVSKWVRRTAEQIFCMWWSDPGLQRTNFLRSELYIPLAVFSIGGLLGWVRFVFKDGHRDWLKGSRAVRTLVVILGLALVVVFVVSVTSQIGKFNMIGRYLFPAFIPAVVVLTVGWAEWVRTRWHNTALKVLFLLLVLLDWWVIVFHLVIRYHAI